MNFEKTKIDGVLIGTTNTLSDTRGSFKRLFCNISYEQFTGRRVDVAQVNKSVTKDKGSIRGLHFQRPPAQEMKIISCVKGRVFDVAVDLRTDSDTYLQHVAIELYEGGPAFVIPEGCAHGFQVLEENSEMMYLHTVPWSKDHEGGLLYNDPVLSIQWPLPATVMSERDQSFAPIDDKFKGIEL